MLADSKICSTVSRTKNDNVWGQSNENIYISVNCYSSINNYTIVFNKNIYNNDNCNSHRKL